MTELLAQAFAAAAALPDEQQDELARLLLDLAAGERPAYILTAEEQEDLDEAEAEVARGETMSLEDAQAVWAKHRF